MDMEDSCISVCLATYNGEDFLAEQLDSIITQLDEDDEIIIVDDGSSDGTLSILEGLIDQRIKIYINDLNKGEVYSFGKAIAQAKNDIIMLADQDDIWIDGRVDLIKRTLQASEAFTLSSNSKFIDKHGSDYDRYVVSPLNFSDSKKHLKNISKIFLGSASYFGCAMAFKQEMKDTILPIPSYVESHDLWIALIANLARSNLHLEKATLFRRVHGNNTSIIKRGFLPKIYSRIVFLISIFSIWYRLIRKTFLALLS